MASESAALTSQEPGPYVHCFPSPFNKLIAKPQISMIAISPPALVQAAHLRAVYHYAPAIPVEPLQLMPKEHLVVVLLRSSHKRPLSRTGVEAIVAHTLRRTPLGDAKTGVTLFTSVALDDLSSNSVSACVGLGHKYEINYVVRRGRNYLKKFFVENLDTWARVDPPRPPAFQGCIRSSADLVNGFTREDGKPEKLSAENIGRWFLGRANLMQANTLATLRVPEAPRRAGGS
ncbi:hypothetical protein DICSQDRAFT_183997 [Dichomitus squalens LYAD-421 SS1]|uniref:Uncharacterized protein n=1 Tax=Dichomitus squalens (strain LYAD-421) TaxID=732165 RepID=R7SK12_DICSQ|nr:uncharacterized protein DICSQDRAFT_183997 [Dichomitus squalens LYAD-421 SS1]EJF56075.1 hypothetical protein DICSQDRAFT_183997 [Dichomitus squalens LYAD-421 SS1]